MNKILTAAILSLFAIATTTTTITQVYAQTEPASGTIMPVQLSTTSPYPVYPPATPPATTTTNSTGGTIIDRPTAAILAAQDPYFARFDQMAQSCANMIFGDPTITPAQCEASLQQGADRWCGFEFYDALKCQYASELTKQFNRVNNLLGGFGLDELPPGLLE